MKTLNSLSTQFFRSKSEDYRLYFKFVSSSQTFDFWEKLVYLYLPAILDLLYGNWKWKVKENSITSELAFREFVDKVDPDKLEKEGFCADYKPKISWTSSQVKSIGANSFPFPKRLERSEVIKKTIFCY